MSYPDPLSVHDQEHAQAQAEERAAQAAQTEVADLRWLMSDARGRRFVASVLERSGVWRLSFNTEALTMAFHEGMRNEGLRLVAQITTHCPERYAEMLQEITACQATR